MKYANKFAMKYVYFVANYGTDVNSNKMKYTTNVVIIKLR